MAKKPSTRKLLLTKMGRDVKKGLAQLLAVFAMGTIAMTLFVGLMANAASLSKRVETLFSAGDTPDIWVVTDDFESADASSIKSLLDEGDTMDERFLAPGKIGSHTSSILISQNKPSLSRPAVSYSVSEEESDEHFFIVDYALTSDGDVELGEAIDPGKEATLSFDFASLLVGYEDLVAQLDEVFIGDDNFIASGRLVFQATVTSSMQYGENIQKSAYSSSCCLLSHDIFESAFQSKLEANYSHLGVVAINTLLGKGFPRSNEYMVSLGDKSTLEAKKDAIRSYFEVKEENNLIEILDRSSSPWSLAADTEVKEATQLSFVFPLVFFLVALLVILTTVSQMIFKERTQIGTMKAIGVKKRDIYFHYLALIGGIALSASVIGSIVGTMLIPAIMAAKYDILYTLPARTFFVFPWYQFLAATSVFLLSALLVTFLAIRKEVSLSPAQSMRPALIKMKGSSFLKGKKPLGLSLSMAIRNIRIAWGKSAMAVAGVAGCTALLLCGFGIQDTIDHGVEVDLDLAYTASLSLSYSTQKFDPRPSYFDRDDILSYDQYYAASTTAKYGGKSYVTQVRLFEDEHPFVKVNIPKGKVAISIKLVHELGVGLGDVIEFSHSGSYLAMEVGEVYESFTFNGIQGLYSDFAGKIDKSFSGAYVQAVEGADLNALSAYFLDNDYASSSQTRVELRQRVADIVAGVSTMTNAVKVFAILLAVVVLYNLALMNFRSHARDVATLKVLGFSLPEIALSLVAESILLTLFGIAIGFGLGFPFLYGVLVVNTVSLVEFLYFIAPLTYAIAFVLTFFVSMLVNVYLSLLLGKVEMVESLKSVE